MNNVLDHIEWIAPDITEYFMPENDGVKFVGYLFYSAPWVRCFVDTGDIENYNKLVYASYWPIDYDKITPGLLSNKGEKINVAMNPLQIA